MYFFIWKKTTVNSDRQEVHKYQQNEQSSLTFTHIFVLTQIYASNIYSSHVFIAIMVYGFDLVSRCILYSLSL